MTIRRLQPDEWPRWKEIRLESLNAHPTAFGSSPEEEVSMPDSEFERRVTDNAIFGAWLDGALIGTVGFHAETRTKTRHRGSMFGMYVKGAARGTGIADSLVDAVINHARSRVTQIHCSVETDNVAALKLYERHGFRIYGTEPGSLMVDGQLHDVHLMIRPL